MILILTVVLGVVAGGGGILKMKQTESFPTKPDEVIQVAEATATPTGEKRTARQDDDKREQGERKEKEERGEREGEDD